jgi:hypothetical protein
VRFGVVFAPGASTASLTTKKASPYIAPADGAAPSARLRDLSSVYEAAAWAADPVASALEAAATGKAGAGGDKAASGAVAGGASADADDAVTLGFLLTKCFIYLKRKAGTNAAARFLSGVQVSRTPKPNPHDHLTAPQPRAHSPSTLTPQPTALQPAPHSPSILTPFPAPPSALQEARQSATSAFFGGGLDELGEHHLESAFRGAFTSALRKAGDEPTAVFKQLSSGELPEIEAASGTPDFVGSNLTILLPCSDAHAPCSATMVWQVRACVSWRRRGWVRCRPCSPTACSRR